MEDAYDKLARRALKHASLKQGEDAERHMIGVAGAPGSGKSTLAREVCGRINQITNKETAINVPMDGFHLYRSQLDSMPDPEEAYRRRGAPWTFDAQGYLEKLRAIKETKNEIITSPSFDHGVGDPKEDAIIVLPNHKIVISEGNYCLLGEKVIALSPPHDARQYMHEAFDEINEIFLF